MGRWLARWPFSTAPLRRLAGLGGQRFTRRIAIGAGLALVVLLAWPADARDRHRAILDAIRQVESGDRDDVPDGDAGLAIGPYQIHRVYWLDAVKHDPRLGPEFGHDYQDCRARAYAERVIEAYMRRWVPEAWRSAHAETIARTHNGGPKGARSTATDRYWERVRRRLPDAAE
ncbi:MAG: hypothetical protein R3F56_02130 [Planctomycetota bacterium]